MLFLNKIESFYHTEMAEFEASFSAMEIDQLCQELNAVTYLFKKIKCSHLCIRNLSQDWESLKNSISLFSISLVRGILFNLHCWVYKAEENLFSTLYNKRSILRKLSSRLLTLPWRCVHSTYYCPYSVHLYRYTLVLCDYTGTFGFPGVNIFKLFVPMCDVCVLWSWLNLTSFWI